MPQRLSDADRDAAVAMLREHFELGRLDELEFTDRMQKALEARFPEDLTPLFTDLPAPRPSSDALGAGWATEELAPWTPPGAVTPSWDPAAATDTPGPGTLDQRRAAPPPWLGTVRALVWPAALALLFITGEWWWIMVAIVVSIALQQVVGQRRPPRPPIGR